MQKKKYEYHPSHVSVSFSRGQVGGRGMALFGSNIYHGTYISMKVLKAEMNRSYNEDKVYSHGAPLIEVNMSPIQFAELITNMNYAMGIPATLRRYGKETYEFPTITNKAEQFKKEVEDDVYDTLNNLKKSITRIDELMNKKSLVKAEKEEVKGIIYSAKKLLDDKLPFILDQFGRQMNNTVAEAKSSVDSFVSHTIQEAGIESLKKNPPIIEIG